MRISNENWTRNDDEKANELIKHLVSSNYLQYKFLLKKIQKLLDALYLMNLPNTSGPPKSKL